MGHTHRPLFESLSKVDSLKFRIESLCYQYPTTAPENKPKLEQKILTLKENLHLLLRMEKGPGRVKPTAFMILNPWSPVFSIPAV